MKDADAEAIIKKLADELEAELWKTMRGSNPLEHPNRMLRVTAHGTFESVAVDAVERCPQCGPILLCDKHMAELA